MNLTRVQAVVRAALDKPSQENRLTASIAINDFSDSLEEKIEKYESVLHKLATSPWAPQRVVDMARDALAMDGDEYIAHLDRGREWPTARND